uniref:Protein amnionless n=1 Tax=Otus sunia TaxID=257818 RepID=A0A8C8AB55_9STRI
MGLGDPPAPCTWAPAPVLTLGLSFWLKIHRFLFTQTWLHAANGLMPPVDWVTLVSLVLPVAAVAVYKQWIPNTNFETASNWDEGRVPCASDVVHFEKDKVLHIFFFYFICCKMPLGFGKYLPLNGEFVLASGAGFAAFDGSWDPGCVTVRFADAEHHAWFNPTLWQAVSPGGELEPSGRIFSVDEERVPCHYDDVIFQPETSFRVNIDSSQREIHLRSISLMGQELSSPEAWAGYLRGPFAPLQFHGNGTLQVTGTGCPDKSGCACGNTLDLHRICAALLEASGRQCPAPACRSPLQPLGHCCGVCGEWGAQPYSSSPPCRLPHQGSIAELYPCSLQTMYRYIQSFPEGYVGESFPGKASLWNMVETKCLSSKPVNKKTSEGVRGFLGQHFSGRALEAPLLGPVGPVAWRYPRIPTVFCGSRSCAAMAGL